MNTIIHKKVAYTHNFEVSKIENSNKEMQLCVPQFNFKIAPFLIMFGKYS